MEGHKEKVESLGLGNVVNGRLLLVLWHHSLIGWSVKTCQIRPWVKRGWVISRISYSTSDGRLIRMFSPHLNPEIHLYSILQMTLNWKSYNLKHLLSLFNFLASSVSLIFKSSFLLRHSEKLKFAYVLAISVNHIRNITQQHLDVFLID